MRTLKKKTEKYPEKTDFIKSTINGVAQPKKDSDNTV